MFIWGELVTDEIIYVVKEVSRDFTEKVTPERRPEGERDLIMQISE